MKIEDVIIPGVIIAGVFVLYSGLKSKQSVDLSREKQPRRGETNISDAYVGMSFWDSIKDSIKRFTGFEQGGKDSPVIPDLRLNGMGDGLQEIPNGVTPLFTPTTNNYTTEKSRTTGTVTMTGTHPVLGDLTGMTISKAEADILISEKVVDIANVPSYVQKSIESNISTGGTITARPAPGGTTIYHSYSSTTPRYTSGSVSSAPGGTTIRRA